MLDASLENCLDLYYTNKKQVVNKTDAPLLCSTFNTSIQTYVSCGGERLL